MKKTLSIIAAALALIMALGCMPLSLAVRAKTVSPRWTVPAGYNEHDYNACAAFLEQTDENGVKNGEKLSENYDPNDPATWGTYVSYNGTENMRFIWSDEGGELRILCLDVSQYTGSGAGQVVGQLDVSGCAALETLYCTGNALTGLNASGCSALMDLWCSSNALTELDVSGNTALEYLFCNNNVLTELDVSGSTVLEYLDCKANELTELDLSGHAAMRTLHCERNPLVCLRLPDNPYFPLETLRADGRGHVGCAISWGSCDVYAYAGPGAEFIGWYDEAGALVSEEDGFFVIDSYSELVARFEDGVLGDMDGDGDCTIADAVLALRAGMGLIEATDEQTALCDIDGDGEITVADALLIMRAAMGLITLG